MRAYFSSPQRQHIPQIPTNLAECAKNMCSPHKKNIQKPGVEFSDSDIADIALRVEGLPSSLSLGVPDREARRPNGATGDPACVLERLGGARKIPGISWAKSNLRTALRNRRITGENSNQLVCAGFHLDSEGKHM
jgi:hypothetical protein